MNQRFHIRCDRISRQARRQERIISAWMRRKRIRTAKDLLDDLRRRPLHSKLFDLEVKLLGKKPPRKLAKLPKHPRSN